jgi:ferredoxin
MIQVFYFSGTGNSLSIARGIANELGETIIIPMMNVLNSSVRPSLTEKIVLVFPTYLMTLPFPVKEFIRRLDLGSVKYVAAIFAAENRGNLCHIALDRLLRLHNSKLDFYCELPTPQNSPTGIRPTQGDKNWLKKIAPENVDKIIASNHDLYKSIASSILESDMAYIKETIGKRLLEKMISAMTKSNKSKLPFYSDETCTGCKVCERICPTSRITEMDKKIEWNHNKTCYYCFACFNSCPEQAILLTNYKIKEGRYINPEITINDLIL